METVYAVLAFLLCIGGFVGIVWAVWDSFKRLARDHHERKWKYDTDLAKYKASLRDDDRQRK